jgi:hypothetical protein
VTVMRLVGAPEPGIDPANQIAISDVPNEQEQRIGGLV